MIHIAIPLQYRRKQLARALGIEQLAIEQFGRRVNLSATEGWSGPLSYIRVPADSLVSHVLRGFEAQLTLQSGSTDNAFQPPNEPPTAAGHQPRLDDTDQNSWLRSAVVEGLAERSVTLELHQIQILTHRHTGEKWIRIARVDRSLRTTLRLKLKQTRVNASVTFDDDVEAADWSIRFAAAEISKLFRQSPESFDVQTEQATLAERADDNLHRAPNSPTRPTVRLFSPATETSTPGVPVSRATEHDGTRMHSKPCRGEEAIGLTEPSTRTAWQTSRTDGTCNHLLRIP